jgi:hypothetical protein
MVSTGAIVGGTGGTNTLMGAVVESLPHAFVTTYVIMVIPLSTPLTTPVLVTVAIVVFKLYQVPPGTDSNNVVLAPAQTNGSPIMPPANAEFTTVIGNVTCELPQVLVSVYVSVAVPAFRPRATPNALTVAIVTSLLLHEPPRVGSV